MDVIHNSIDISYNKGKSSLSNSMHSNILVIDDDPAILEVMKIILEEEQYNVATHKNGNEICKKIESHDAGLILLDFWIPPGIDGGQIVKHLKSIDSMKKIPVIIISANHNLEKTVKEVGADDFIAKPFDIEILLKKVKKYTSSTYTQLS